MFGPFALGAGLTAFALIAVVCGYAVSFRHGRIGAHLSLGRIYIACTAITGLTGLGIFQHGGFNVAYALGVLTLVFLGAAMAAGAWRDRSRLAKYVEPVAYSGTLFFHMVPGITESITRFPMGSPSFTGPEDPKLRRGIGFVLLAFIFGVVLQVRHIWKTSSSLRRTGLA